MRAFWYQETGMESIQSVTILGVAALVMSGVYATWQSSMQDDVDQRLTGVLTGQPYTGIDGASGQSSNDPTQSNETPAIAAMAFRKASTEKPDIASRDVDGVAVQDPVDGPDHVIEPEGETGPEDDGETEEEGGDDDDMESGEDENDDEDEEKDEDDSSDSGEEEPKGSLQPSLGVGTSGFMPFGGGQGGSPFGNGFGPNSGGPAPGSSFGNALQPNSGFPNPQPQATGERNTTHRLSDADTHDEDASNEHAATREKRVESQGRAFFSGTLSEKDLAAEPEDAALWARFVLNKVAGDISRELRSNIQRESLWALPISELEQLRETAKSETELRYLRQAESATTSLESLQGEADVLPHLRDAIQDLIDKRITAEQFVFEKVPGAKATDVLSRVSDWLATQTTLLADNGKFARWSRVQQMISSRCMQLSEDLSFDQRLLD